jgi:hypothetical protein
MGSRRRIRRSSRPRRTISCGAADRAPLDVSVPASPTAEARVITLNGTGRWLITVVARLVSEDVATGAEIARLVLRLECLTQSHQPVGVATVRARTLHSVDNETLRALLRAPGLRARRGE